MNSELKPRTWKIKQNKQKLININNLTLVMIMEKKQNKIIESNEEMNKLTNFDKYKWPCNSNNKKPSKENEKL